MIHLLEKKSQEKKLEGKLDKKELVSSFTLAENELEVKK